MAVALAALGLVAGVARKFPFYRLAAPLPGLVHHVSVEPHPGTLSEGTLQRLQHLASSHYWAAGHAGTMLHPDLLQYCDTVPLHHATTQPRNHSRSGCAGLARRTGSTML